MNKQNVVYTYNRILFSLKKERNSDYNTLQNATIWTNLEDIMLSERRDKFERQILYGSTYMR